MADEGKHLSGLARSQRRSGLVHNDQPGIAGERPDHHHALLFSHRKIPDTSKRGDLEAALLVSVANSASSSASTPDETQRSHFLAKKNVVEHGPLRDERRFLVNQGDTVGQSVAGAGELYLLAVEQHRPEVGKVSTADNAAQGGLAGTVLSD